MKKCNGSILILDDDEHVVLTANMILKQYFEKVDTLLTPVTLESRLRQSEYDVILLDMNFKAGVTSGNEGIFWLNRIRKLSPHTQVVLQTAYGGIELAVKSIKEGAVDFLPKPWDKEKLISTLLNAYQQAHSRKENLELKNKKRALQQHLNENHRKFIAASPAMQIVLKTIDQVAGTDANVLILGENGTGKDVIAHAIHNRSHRAEEPFITVDSGAVPTSLFESEMFGHEKGAFTDAKEAKVGKFELANGGTLFLDEIGNLTPELQMKILTVLQNRKISRIGSNKIIDLDVRVICATNAPLYDLVKNGIFRQDLFYRINTVEIHVPPLRERIEDIPLLISHYFEEYCKKYNKQLEIYPVLMGRLEKYAWPGNIRELQHAVERAVIMCSQPNLGLRDFQLAPGPSYEDVQNKILNLASIEHDVIRQAIKKWNGNITKASEELGIGRTTLYRKMEEYGITL